MSILNYTAQSRSLTTLLGYCSQTHSLSDLLSSTTKNKVKGFCNSVKCLGSYSGDVYKVLKLGTAKFITGDKNLSYCPDCRNALFWSKNYEYLADMREFIQLECARKINNLPSLIKRKK